MKIKLVLSAYESNSKNSDMLSFHFARRSRQSLTLSHHFTEKCAGFISDHEIKITPLKLQTGCILHCSTNLVKTEKKKLLRMNLNLIIDLKAIYTVCLHSKSASWKLMQCVGGGGADIYSCPNNVFIYTPLCFNHFLKKFYFIFFKCYQ